MQSSPGESLRNGESGTAPPATTPQSGPALVLSGGGARASYQVGVLLSIAERVPDLRFPIITGVSAGAINATYLAAANQPLGAALRGLATEWGRLTADRVYRLPTSTVIGSMARWVLRRFQRRRGDPVIRGLLDPTPLRSFLEGCIDVGRIETAISSGRLRALALSTTAYRTGTTTLFVQGRADLPLWRRIQHAPVPTRITLDHVLASSAIPLLFPAVRVDGEFYGDGSIRQAAPLAPAIHLGARRVLAIAMRTPQPEAISSRLPFQYPTAAEVMGLLFNTFFSDALEADAERLNRINRLLAGLPPTVSATAGLSHVELLLLQPSRDLGALALGQDRMLPHTMRWIVRSMGGRQEAAAGFLSYLLFDPGYTTQLIELGYEDGRREWARIEPFLAQS